MQINNPFGLRSKMGKPLQCASIRAGKQFRIQQRSQSHYTNALTRLAEQLAACQKKFTLANQIHSLPQFFVIVSSIFKIVLVTNVQAANSAASYFGFLFDSPMDKSFS